MKNLVVLLLLVCFHVNDSYAQFTLEKVFDGYVDRVYAHWNEDFSKEEADDYRSMIWHFCYYPLGYFYSERREGNTFTIIVYDDHGELYTKKTYSFQIPSGYSISSVQMCYAIMEEPFFVLRLSSSDRKRYQLCAYDINGKMIYDFGNSEDFWDIATYLFEMDGKLCFLVRDNAGGRKTYVYSVQSPSRLAAPMLEHQPAVIVAPDRLTVFSASGKSEVLKIYTTNGELYDSKALNTEGKTTYMTTGLEKGMYIYDVGGESGKFVVK